VKEWKDLSTPDKRKLLVYETYLKIENPTDDEKTESCKLTKYCLLNDLDISQIPGNRKEG
jgi:hypothetical protein